MDTLRMTLADVARLAGVQRSVASMWRKRHGSRSLHPFPLPVDVRDGVARFAADAVVAWLAQTGLGKNPDAALDAAAYALPAGLGEAEAFQVVSALLALRALHGNPLSPTDADAAAEDLLDLAEELDPDDEFLYGELEAAAPVKEGRVLTELAAYADLLTEADYNPGAAFDRVLSRHRRLQPAGTDTAVVPEVVDLMADVTAALAADLPGPVFVDPSPSDGDVLLAVTARLEHDDAVLSVSGDSAAARLLRRRLAAHGVARADLPVDEDGGFDVGVPCVLAAHYPCAGVPNATPEQILAAVDQIALQMDDRQRAVVLAPAEILCAPQAPGSEAEATRSGLLREGRVRAIVQLPGRLVPGRPRQLLALWILGPAYPEVPIPQRWTMVADLSGHRLSADVVQDLTGDVAAAMGNNAALRAHSFRFLHQIMTPRLLAASTSLVSLAHAGPVQRPDPGWRAARADMLLEQLSRDTPVDALFHYSIESAPGTAARPVPVADLMADGKLRYLPGNRIVPDAFPEGGTRVIGTPELLGERSVGSRRIDLLHFTAAHESGRLTEPGDIIFCTGPTAAAYVDAEGGAVVVFPARVLRITDRGRAELLPDLVAADIAARGQERGPWKRWPLRLARTGSADLPRLLADIERQLQAARERAELLRELTTLVVDGVAAGTLAVTSAAAESEGIASAPENEGRRRADDHEGTEGHPVEGR